MAGAEHQLLPTHSLAYAVLPAPPQGQVAVPDPSQLLPEDLASGGVSVKLDTLNGAVRRCLLAAFGDSWESQPERV